MQQGQGASLAVLIFLGLSYFGSLRPRASPFSNMFGSFQKVAAGITACFLVMLFQSFDVAHSETLLGVSAQSRSITVSFSGDLLTHTPLWEGARTESGYDFDDQLKPLRSLLQADVNLCHLETPLTKANPRSYPIFATPVESAAAIEKSGFDGCSTASNHPLDMGEKGVVFTKSTLLKFGLGSPGTRIDANDDAVAY